jgi:hypothetical protein
MNAGLTPRLMMGWLAGIDTRRFRAVFFGTGFRNPEKNLEKTEGYLY